MNDAKKGPLFTLLAEVTNPPFDSVNPHFKSKYASLAGILAHIKPFLKQNGFVITQDVKSEQDYVLVVTTLLGEVSYAFGPVGMKHDGNIQKLGSIVTYLRRYSILACLGIVGDEDEDGNVAVPKPFADRALPSQPETKRPVEQTAVRPPPAKPSLPEWRFVPIHFGKHKGTALEEIPNKSVHWYYNEWMPQKMKDERFPPKADDLRLMDALKAWHDEIEARKAKDNPPEDLENEEEDPF